MPKYTFDSVRTVFIILLWFVAAPITSAQVEAIREGDALEKLRVAAEHAHSDAVLILRDGETVAEWYFGRERRPVELMSVLKSVVAIGIGRLLELEKIDSLDQPVYTFYPEWKQGQKQEITIRHLLNHTSGLQDVPNAGAEIYPSPNAVRLALAAELSEEPGSTFRYNNKATNLLAGIIEEAYGQRMDQFFVNELFRAMSIEEYKWYYDRSGTPHAMAGLELHARDLAKFAQLVLDSGMWKGERLVGEDYINEMLDQSQPDYPRYGLLWWRLPKTTRYVLDEARLSELQAAGVDAADLARLRPLAGRTFMTREDRDAALAETFGADWRDVLSQRFRETNIHPVFRTEYDDFVAYYGDGYLGQTLMIVPEQRVVAVRQVRGGGDYDPATDGFRDFKDYVLRWLKE